MITVKELKEITEQSKNAAKENLHQWVQKREKSISHRLREKAQQGNRKCCYPFPKNIDGYSYTYQEMKILLKAEFPDFTITCDNGVGENYWFVLEW